VASEPSTRSAQFDSAVNQLRLGPGGDIEEPEHPRPVLFAGLNLPTGHTIVRVPTHLLPELQHDVDASDLLVRGEEVNDVELLTELNLPMGETVVRIPAAVLPGLRKEPQRC